MIEGVFITPQEAMELVLNETLIDHESRPSLKAVKSSLAFHNRFTSILLVKVVWDKISGHTCRASVSSSSLLTDPFRWNTIGGWNVYQTFVCIPRLGSPILPFPLVVIPWGVRSRMLPSVYFVQRVRTR